MKHFMVCALLAVGLAAAQDRPSTYDPLMMDVVSAQQVDCGDAAELPAGSACYYVANTPDLVRMQLDTHGLTGAVEWVNTWQRDENGTTRGFYLDSNPHVVYVGGEDFDTYVVFQPVDLD